MAQRYMPEFPLGFVGAMMLTTAVAAVAIWLVRSAPMEPLRLWWSARHWTRTTCRLARLETDHGPLWYTYRFGGAEYESKRFSTEVTGTEEYLPAQVDELMKVHGLGGDVDGWVNPANPREALLDRSLEAAELLVFAPAVLAVVMFLCALPMAPKFWLWLTYRPDPPLSWAEWFGSFYQNLNWMFTMGGALFMIPGLLLLNPLTISPWLNWWRSQRWVETTCVMTKNSLRGVTMGSGSRASSTTVIEIEYEYDHGGHRYRGTRFSPWSTPGTDWLLQSADSSKIKTMLESVEVGSRRPCYVNPADPGQAFLMRVRDPFAFIGSAVAPVLLAMGWFILLVRPRNG